MAHTKQALKRIRQSEKKRIRAKSIRNEIKTISKRIAELVASKNEAEARKLLQSALSRLDKASKVHIYHRNAAGRRKSKLTLLVNSIGAAGSSPKG
jgi:small subunit ribosomal protein S20